MRSLTIGDFALGNSFRLIWYSTALPPLSPAFSLLFLSWYLSSLRYLLGAFHADNSWRTIVFSNNLWPCKSFVAILNKVRSRINADTHRHRLVSVTFFFSLCTPRTEFIAQSRDRGLWRETELSHTRVRRLLNDGDALCIKTAVCLDREKAMGRVRRLTSSST